MDRFYEWKRRVYLLDVADIKLLDLYERKKINKKQYKKFKSHLDDLWIQVWDYYPDKNPSVDKAYKENFK